MNRLGIALVSAASLLFLGGCSHQTTVGQVPNTPVYTGSTQPGLIPAGTTIAVRTDETVDARPENAGRTFNGEVTREIIGGNGAVLVPARSPARLEIFGVNQGGALTNGAIQLGLQSITVNGRTYMVSSPSLTVSGNRGLGANKRTAEFVGGGAALGTLLGAVVGGGTGAAVGAAVGAAGGAAAQVVTKGHHVHVPAESVLTFRTSEPIRLVNFRS